MSNKTSIPVLRESKRLWAVLATVAARRAVEAASADEFSRAEVRATIAIGWLEKAGADATHWVYVRPRS
jgi:hypothetical protein